MFGKRAEPANSVAALRRRLPLATLDADLLAAMQRCGVPRVDLAI